jgi:hypothetical protein
MVQCPICIEQKTVRRGYIEEKDLRAHLRTMHLKSELGGMLAKVVWNLLDDDMHAKVKEE